METKAGGGVELNLKNYEVSSCRLQKKAGFYFLRTYVGGTCISYFVSIKKKYEKPAMRYSVFYQKGGGIHRDFPQHKPHPLA